jgi:hypothetical protein
MARHRGTFDPGNPSPYELSRSRIENFVRCKACFYLRQVKGIKFPSIPGFNLNEATDVLLKRYFDVYREKQTTPAILKIVGLGGFVPYQHPDFEKWTQSLHFGAEGRFHHVDSHTNILVGGGIDDIWVDSDSGELHVVDYKSTSRKTSKKEISLDDKWKAAYKRQMDLYVWIMMSRGMPVSKRGYFLYVDGDRFSEYDFIVEDTAWMRMNLTLHNYDVDFSWIRGALSSIKDTLSLDRCPPHSEECEYGRFIDDLSGIT